MSTDGWPAVRSRRDWPRNWPPALAWWEHRLGGWVPADDIERAWLATYASALTKRRRRRLILAARVLGFATGLAVGWRLWWRPVSRPPKG